MTVFLTLTEATVGSPSASALARLSDRASVRVRPRPQEARTMTAMRCRRPSVLPRADRPSFLLCFPPLPLPPPPPPPPPPHTNEKSSSLKPATWVASVSQSTFAVASDSLRIFAHKHRGRGDLEATRICARVTPAIPSLNFNETAIVSSLPICSTHEGMTSGKPALSLPSSPLLASVVHRVWPREDIGQE